MVVFPNAKINIGLNITGRRPDGYHNLETVMIPAGWSDVLEIVPAKGADTTLTLSGRRVDCDPEKNLVMKAYRALDAVEPLPPVDIYLRKIIPDGAGLGGGSADASFTLVALNRMFDLGLSDATLSEIAAGLGADCPFFIHNRPMLATGTGTDLTAVDIPQLQGLTLLIVKPQVKISTAEAYAGVTPARPAEALSDLILEPVGNWRGKIVNDFEKSLDARFPIIREIKEALYNGGAMYASLSGSGSAVYGIFDDDRLTEHLGQRFQSCDIFKCTL